MLNNNIIDPTIAKQGPTINSLNFLINLEAKILPTISPALKKITIDQKDYNINYKLRENTRKKKITFHYEKSFAFSELYLEEI